MLGMRDGNFGGGASPAGRVSAGGAWRWALAGALAALVAISAVKASRCGFTHDECLTFQIFAGDGYWIDTMNHHVLNTWCMRVGAAAFGQSELALRLHSVLAHALYVVASVLVLRHVRTLPAQVVGFALLNLNLFILDFFFLARGYGLALAFQLVSIHLLLVGGEQGKGRQPLPWIAAALASGALSTLSNYAFINYYVPGFAVAVLILARHAWSAPSRPRAMLGAAAVTLCAAAFLALVLIRLFELRSADQMYWGGEGGFVPEVLGSLVDTWMYTGRDAGWMRTAGVVAIVVLSAFAVACAVARVVRTRSLGDLEWVVMICAGSVALTIAQRLLLGTPYPIERYALYLVPPFAVGVALALGRVIREHSGTRWSVGATAASGAVAAVLAARFFTGLNLEHSLTWRYDAYSADVLERVKHDRNEHFRDSVIKVGAYWALEPSLNFVRSTRGYAWMLPVTRELDEQADYHYIYCLDWQAGQFAADEYSTVIRYPDSGTVLLRAVGRRGDNDAAHQPDVP